MRSPYLQQILLVILTAGLTAWIFLQGKDSSEALTDDSESVAEGKTKEQGGQKPPMASEAQFDFGNYRDNARGNLPDSIQDVVRNIEKQTEKAQLADTNKLVRLAGLWKKHGFPAVAAKQYQKIAELKGTGPNWYRAASHYQEAQKHAKDSLLADYVNKQAIKGFKRLLEKNPDHLDAKANLALAYVEGQGAIMKGVRLLKEVEEADPEHEKALFYLGILSTRSGQYEKALERFERLKKLQPDNAFLHFHIGNVYAQMGENAKAVEAFEAYKAKVEQPQLKKRAEEQIQRLKNS